MNEQETVAEPGVRYHWYHKVTAVIFIIFCLEVGLFLLIFPWTEKWSNNLMASFHFSAFPRWSTFWQSPYVRGAVSGIGVLDLYVCFSEIFRLKRFSGR